MTSNCYFLINSGVWFCLAFFWSTQRRQGLECIVCQDTSMDKISQPSHYGWLAIMVVDDQVAGWVQISMISLWGFKTSKDESKIFELTTCSFWSIRYTRKYSNDLTSATVKVRKFYWIDFSSWIDLYWKSYVYIKLSSYM